MDWQLSLYILQRSSSDDDDICGKMPGIKMQDLFLLDGLRTDQVDVMNSLKKSKSTWALTSLPSWMFDVCKEGVASVDPITASVKKIRTVIKISMHVCLLLYAPITMLTQVCQVWNRFLVISLVCWGGLAIPPACLTWSLISVLSEPTLHVCYRLPLEMVRLGLWMGNCPHCHHYLQGKPQVNVFFAYKK